MKAEICFDEHWMMVHIYIHSVVSANEEYQTYWKNNICMACFHPNLNLVFSLSFQTNSPQQDPLRRNKEKIAFQLNGSQPLVAWHWWLIERENWKKNYLVKPVKYVPMDEGPHRPFSGYGLNKYYKFFFPTRQSLSLIFGFL